MALTKPPVLPPWAESGDKVQPTDGEIQTGWPLSNVPPSRQRFNWLLNFLSNGIRYLTRRGLPDWAADEAYEVGDRVIGPDNNTYRCIQAGTNHAPASSPLYWERWGYAASDLTNLLNQQDYKSSVRVASTANIASLSGLLTVDGVTLIAGNRVLVKDQSTASQNGIWVVASGAWARAIDADDGSEFNAGCLVPVEEGSTQADTLWQMSTDGNVTIGVTSLNFVQTSGQSVGTPGTYVSVTTDAKGRVIAGATTQAWSTITGTPTTLAGYGITDGNYDPTARGQLAITNLRLILNTSVATGALLYGKQWELSTDEWGSTSTNETYTSASPSYYMNGGLPVQVSQATGTVIGNASGNPGAWYDGNTNQNSGASSYVGAGTLWVGKDWGAGTPKQITGFKTWGSNDRGYQGDAVAHNMHFVLVASNTNDPATATVLYTSPTFANVNNANAKDYSSALSSAASYRYTWVGIVDEQWSGGFTTTVCEVQFFTPGTPVDMTLIPPASVSLSSAPAYGNAYFLWKDDSGTAVLGTDLTVELSRDGGATWVVATLTNLTPSAGFDGTYAAIQARASFAGQPTGTSLTCRIKTLNTKAQRVAAPALYAE